MTYTVLITDDASDDLDSICGYIDRYDVPGKADYVLTKIEETLNSLSESPHRGTYPKELMSVGVREYRKIFFNPYRIIYKIFETNVYVLLIADGRRDMETLLHRRLLLG